MSEINFYCWDLCLCSDVLVGRLSLSHLKENTSNILPIWGLVECVVYWYCRCVIAIM